MATNAHEYSIWIAEYARVQEYPVGGAIYGQHNAGTLVLPYCYGVLKSDEHTILVDTGFDNAEFGKELADTFGVTGWQPPSVVLGRLGIDPADVDTSSRTTTSTTPGTSTRSPTRTSTCSRPR